MLSFQNFTNNCNKKRRARKMYGVKDCKILKSLKNIQNFTKKNTTYQLLLSAISCKDIFCYGEYLCKILSHINAQTVLFLATLNKRFNVLFPSVNSTSNFPVQQFKWKKAIFMTCRPDCHHCHLTTDAFTIFRTD